MMIDLTTDQEKRAVALFAQGFSRSEVVILLIDAYPELEQPSADRAKLRKELSDKLRFCDPSSPRFAVAKHQSDYDFHLDALKRVIRHHYQQVALKSVKSVEHQLAETDATIADLQHNLDTALDITPIGTSDYICLVNVQLRLQKHQLELEDKLLERHHRIHEQMRGF